MREQLEGTGFSLGMDDGPTEILWVRFEEQIAVGDTAGDVCRRPPDQEEQLDEAFYRLLKAAVVV